MNKRKETCEYALRRLIMEYWQKCIEKAEDRKADGDINDLLEDYVRGCGVSYHYDDLALTVGNLTNAQKRGLYNKMLRSGILER